MYRRGRRVPIGKNTFKAPGAKVVDAAVRGQHRDANATDDRIVEDIQVVHRKSRRHADLTRLALLGQTPHPGVRPDAEHDAGVLCEALRRVRTTTLLQVPWTRDQNKPERAEVARDQGRVGEGAGTDRDVEGLLNQVMQQVQFMKNVGLLGGALLISQIGAGPVSLDARRAGS